MIDELRGAAIICMVVFHSFITMQSFDRFCGFGEKMFNFFLPASPYFAGLFVVICGMSCYFSHSNYKRGLKLLSVAVLLTAATLLIDAYLIDETAIIFGILHMLSVSILIFALSRRLIDKIPVIIGLILNMFLFLFTYNIENRYLGIDGIFKIDLPSRLYDFYFLFPFGLCSDNFASADYYPLIPWFFLFMFGAYLGRTAISGHFPKFMYRKRFAFLSAVGKYTLWIYIFHQPIIYGLLYVSDLLLNLIGI